MLFSVSSGPETWGNCYSRSYYYYYCCFLGPHLWHMEVPRLGVKLEIQLSAYATTTATRYLSCVWNLRHGSRKHQILNPLIKARDRTHILMDTSWIHFCWAMMGTPLDWVFIHKYKSRDRKGIINSVILVNKLDLLHTRWFFKILCFVKVTGRVICDNFGYKIYFMEIILFVATWWT